MRSRQRERDRRRSPTAERHADSLRLALMEVAPAGLKKTRLMAVTELSRSQLVRGLAAYRELAGEKGWPPLVWSAADGYHFCLDADALEEWERQWADVKFTQISRVITGVLAPHARLFPKSRWVQYIVAQMNAVQSALDMIARPQTQ
ncbi:RacP protein [Streptomyces sp. NBC_00237]|uniref:RacP protein n=1 Tax=Streptomyces sp. NBC_00237 TaxID=2975687 RepID=UPI002251CC2F|nr:RacP protein [Streptomyces sp. NBC_00237]MCX5206062.1 RacP protein [Streptomyces sp. NBC_00237]